MRVSLTLTTLSRCLPLLPLALCACSAQQDTEAEPTANLPNQLTINSYCDYMSDIPESSRQTLFLPKLRELFDADELQLEDRFISDFKVAYIAGQLRQGLQMSKDRSVFIEGCTESLAEASNSWTQ